MRVQLASDEAGSLGVEIDEDGTVVAFTHRGSEAETSGLPLGGQIVGVNGERVRGAAAIHDALEAGAPGPFDLEVHVPRIMRSTPPPQLPLWRRKPWWRQQQRRRQAYGDRSWQGCDFPRRGREEDGRCPRY